MKKIVWLFIMATLIAGRCSETDECRQKHFIGEAYGGGMIFYITSDSCHGLIAAKEDQGLGNLPQWSNGVMKITGANSDGLNAGLENTEKIVSAQIPDNPSGVFAARLCADYRVVANGVEYNDWYLPSRFELNLLYHQRDIVGIVCGPLSSCYYWTSNETAFNEAITQEFIFGSVSNTMGKGNNYHVRAIRNF